MNVDNRDISVLPGATGNVGAGIRWTPIERVRGALNALVARLFAPVDNSSIVTFRVAFGLMMFWEVYRYFQKGWIDAFYTDPQFNFPYHGFEWVKPWPGIGMQLHFLALAILSVCIMLGYRYRLSATLFFFGFTYIFLLEKAHYLNHLYLACLISFLMIFVPAHQAFSLDARRRPSLRSDTAPTWALVLLAFQVGIIYVYGGFAKINWDWLDGEPMRIWMANETQFPILGRWFTEEWMVYAVSYGGLLFDLFIVPLLLWPRTRWFAVIVLVLFHRFNAMMFSIGIFPMFATLAVVLFLPPDLPRRIVQKFRTSYGNRPQRKKSRKAAPEPAAELEAATAITFTQRPLVQRATIVLIALYVAIQLLVPLRHFLYPGLTSWTDEGDRFAWRMMLVSKVGEVSFTVLDPASGQTWEVDPLTYLTSTQAGQMESQPDMILQFSHFLADEWRKDGYNDVEVRAQSSISLNGREPYPIVDPTVDLAAEELSIWPADWITNIEELQRAAADNPEEAKTP
jgi:hypothetical protein